MAMYSENMMMIHVPMDRPVYISLSMQGMELTGDMPRSALPENDTPMAMRNRPAQ